MSQNDVMQQALEALLAAKPQTGAAVDYHYAAITALRKAIALTDSPVAWYVTGCHRMLDEYDAMVEAKQIGGGAEVLALYLRPANARLKGARAGANEAT